MEKRIHPDQYLPLTESTYYILLALTEPRHGYAIMQFAEEISDGKTKIGPGTLYGAITKLLKEKLIIPWKADGGGNANERGRENDRRKLYTLTPLGQNVLRLEFIRLNRLVRNGQGILKEDGQEK